MTYQEFMTVSIDYEDSLSYSTQHRKVYTHVTLLPVMTKSGPAQKETPKVTAPVRLITALSGAGRVNVSVSGRSRIDQGEALPRGSGLTSCGNCEASNIDSCALDSI